MNISNRGSPFTTEVKWEVSLDRNGDASHLLFITLNNPNGRMQSSLIAIDLPTHGIYQGFEINLCDANSNSVAQSSYTFEPGFIPDNNQLHITLDSLKEVVAATLSKTFPLPVEPLKLRVAFEQKSAATECGGSVVFLMPIKTRLQATSIDLHVILPKLHRLEKMLIKVQGRRGKLPLYAVSPLAIYTIVSQPRIDDEEGRVSYAFKEDRTNFQPIAFCYKNNSLSLNSFLLAVVSFTIGALITILAVINDLFGLKNIIDSLP